MPDVLCGKRTLLYKLREACAYYRDLGDVRPEYSRRIRLRLMRRMWREDRY